ncbi:uncharacterized protein N7496_006370 [Penicillium cataractarum]|uniref:GPI anchored serine-threonine rich protein n=1 Tax=Penicillium cataractarum TaxID=2100454 RepID=A0A9W9S1F1_9EURO|nr:uncharacterized protein N7496_006370 [Penicillium cataractarum]KAJ5370278.1 hypothetical protein N7496_006370 [Penicillium cataractarum]
MRSIATKLPLLLAASATIVVGLDATTTGTKSVSTGSSSKCAAQKVVDQCLQDMKFQLENCGTYDWDCQCIGSTNVVDCYNNCPEHPDRVGAQTIRQQNCANAKAYDPKTTSSTPSSTASYDIPSSSSSAASSAHASESTSIPSGLKSTTDDEDSSSEPTKSLTGLAASSTSSQGAAAGAVGAAGGWVAFLGLALGVLF